jgi:hypothetical protein
MLPDSFLSRRAMMLGVSAPLLFGCRRRDKKIAVQQTDEDSATLATVVYMGDPKTAPQLLKGFYNIEENTWRWTMGHFAVALRPPRNAAIRGAILHLKFVFPEAVQARVKTISISAAIDGTPLPAESYSKPGDLEYTREVDRKLLAGDAVNVEFALDKFLPAGAVEQRELGIIATSAGFEAK